MWKFTGGRDGAEREVSLADALEDSGGSRRLLLTALLRCAAEKPSRGFPWVC